MEKIDILNNIIKIFYINLLSYFVLIKVINYKNNTISKNIYAFLESIAIAILYGFLYTYVYTIVNICIISLIHGIYVRFITKIDIDNFVISYIISLLITYFGYLFSVILVGMVLTSPLLKIEAKANSSLICILIIMTLVIFSILKIKRLKNGLNFLINKASRTLTMFIVTFAAITIIIFTLLQNRNIKFVNTLVLLITIEMLIFFIIWLQSQITKHYKKNMRDRTISVQKAEIDEQTKLLEEVEAENLKLATAVHKYNHRLSSLELAMKSAISHNLNTEFADELSVMLKDTEDLSNSFAKECDVAKCILPLTNVPSIDNMFKYMQDEASKCNINFDLKINESINDLIDNIIPKDMFETLLGDHLRDAIIAVNASDNSYKSILTTLGLVDGCYELSIYDTGIEFQIDTLLKLGKEQVTTHKDSGGSGIGFITTFETLKTTKASLVIEEYSPETTNYTKSVNIRFDGKNQYRIYSYRADDIKKQNKEKRIIVKNIE